MKKNIRSLFLIKNKLVFLIGLEIKKQYFSSCAITEYFLSLGAEN